MKQSREILYHYWKYDNFRPMQEEIVDAAIYGNDVLALLPTGGGKSICFQVPGLAREGLCIVISPLIALMDDQVMQLQRRGIRAKAITSAMPYREIENTLDNARFEGLDFLYVSPERLKTRLFKERFKLMKIGLIVVDEAHCISEWGHDFRPSYREIANLREVFLNIPMMAVTATATPEVKQDIIVQLKLKEPKVFEASFVRPNISYEVYRVENKLNAIRRVTQYFPNQTGIIYCQTRKSVKRVAQYLISKGISVGIYHGGMNAEQRSEMLSNWLQNRFLIMIATNAFGMGIDKPDVRYVAHFEFPNNPEALFQEAGRAGRDGQTSRTFVFFDATEFSEMERQLQKQFPDLEMIKRVYQAIGSYLKLAYGSGQGETFPFDIRSFVSTYQLDYLDVYYSIKFLELSNYFVFSESVFHPTRVKFLVNNTVLYSFQVKNEKMVKLTTFLSRSFPGIFDEYMDIHESILLKRLQLTPSELEKQLQYLEQNGILEVSWKSDLPVIYYVTERLPEENIHIDGELYNVRKKTVLQRWEVMKNYIQQTEECRAQLLIRYFGQEVEPCGKCDVCLRKAAQFNSDEARSRILKLAEKQITLDEIYRTFGMENKSKVIAILNDLFRQDVLAEKDGTLILTR